MSTPQTAQTDTGRREHTLENSGNTWSDDLPSARCSVEAGKFRALLLILSVFIVVGIANRIANLLLDSSLWEDEIFSVALAESPLIDLLLAALRFDTHPPLYYVQLHFWGAFSDSDHWYILNSTLLSIVSIAVIFETCRRRYDIYVGLWAAAIFAVMPLQLFFAENVRMYAMLAILQILLWYVLQAMIDERRASTGKLAAALSLGLAVTFTHGLGFFVAFFSFLLAMVRMFGRAPKKDFLFLIATYVVVALGALYPVTIGIIRRTEGIAVFDLPTIGIHLTLTLFGMEFPWPTVAGFVIFPAVTLLSLLERRARWISIMLVLLPCAVLLAISLLAKPVLIYRTLGLFLPYIAISLALYADSVFKAVAIGQRLAVAAIMFVLFAGGINHTLKFEKSGYREIVAALQASSTPDAVIMTNGPSEFWAVLRYLDEGAGRRSAIDIQPPVREGMLRIKEKLDEVGAGGLGLFGLSNHALVGNRKIYPYFDDDAASKLSVFWVLNPSASGCAPPSAAVTAGPVRYQAKREIAVADRRVIECVVLR